MTADQPGLAREACDAFAAAADVVVVDQLGMDARGAVVAARLGVDPLDHCGVHSVDNPPLTRRPFPPRAEPLSGDAEPVTYELDREGRCFFQQILLHPQHPVLRTQPFQLDAFVGRETIATAVVDVSLGDPVRDRLRRWFVSVASRTFSLRSRFSSARSDSDTASGSGVTLGLFSVGFDPVPQRALGNR